MSDDENNSDVLARHRREKKELQAKIQTLKKSAVKGDKKKKKEVTEEIARLELNLDQRQAEELQDANTSQLETLEIVDTPDSVDDAKTPDRMSKAQRRREKKEQEEKQRRVEIAEQELLNKQGPRHLEALTLKELLKARGLILYPILSDGDCLYNAVRHQLTMHKLPECEVSKLRQLTADYIAANKDTLIFYMTAADGNVMGDKEFEKYCDSVRNTRAWGGQIEIQALSHCLRVPIEVLQATGPPTIQGLDEFPDRPKLIITYHRHMYSLGEHYNSSSPKSGDGDNDDGPEGDVPKE